MAKALKNDSILLPAHYTQVAAMVAGIGAFTVQPNVIPRAATEADGWAHFRVRSLKFRLHPPVTAPTAPQFVGYVGGIQDTPPNSQANVAELINSTVLGARTTTPTAWVRVPAKELAGPFPWYKSLPGTADATEEAPGAIYVAGTGTDPFVLELLVVFEFKNSLATNNTPAMAALRAQLSRLRVEQQQAKAREKAIGLLTGPSPSSTPPIPLVGVAVPGPASASFGGRV